MNTENQYSLIILDLIRAYLTCLFLYTCLSKLATFTAFKFDLNRNPIIGKIAGPVSILLPLSEIAIAYMLFFRPKSMWGWRAATLLMATFTLYVLGILLFIPKNDIPCSCGGVIRFMSWQNHLVLNIITTGLALVGSKMTKLMTHKKTNRFSTI